MLISLLHCLILNQWLGCEQAHMADHATDAIDQHASLLLHFLILIQWLGCEQSVWQIMLWMQLTLPGTLTTGLAVQSQSLWS